VTLRYAVRGEDKNQE